MFITFEGLDFCGKTTQIELLKDYLLSKGKRVEVLREPGGTLISEKIRDLLLDRKNSEMYEETELLLFAASRAQLVREFVIPRIKEGFYLLSDRFHDSSIAYQGYGRKLNLDFVIKLQQFAINSAVPDLTFFIDLPIEEIEKRKALREHSSLDRIEISEKNFYLRVREGYLKLYESEPRIIKLNGLKSIQEIHREIVKTVENFEREKNEK